MKRSFMRSRNDAKLCLAAGRIHGVRRTPPPSGLRRALSNKHPKDKRHQRHSVSRRAGWGMCGGVEGRDA